ncbi:hypothetical protein OE699_07985 [Sedimentimonas flavescens]|uniref:Uncharacterized protein n=1 Tax=Sedimentimonas flavescens TaxID=2851012 RepID=A0ABT2ZYG5_9RHOB|nr:hypothetical protein [Sedimentimonas flavescens]MBW0157700.1 hypothetical protein [Sedimentimonas flavescens]MCT2540829.1 hypothetical protein [Sedimentimonas flavescens]MCV2878791.1 hypothetical protein [Sedimentimonas flavescens]WBL31977.1 hypothetical protein O5O51_09480 [Sinirhodobacter sp. HNIBRBA609]
MSDTLEKLQARLAELETQIEQEWDAQREQMRYHIERGKIEFEEGVREAHRMARVHLWLFLRRSRPLVFLTVPVIYAVVIPFALLDLFVTIYQWVCFPVYGIEKVRRRDHIVIDRQNLAYLNAIQKLNCMYCGYGNGVVSYVREVSARTEKYWCPIKHARRVKGAHAYYGEFCDFGDAEGFEKNSPRFRRELRKVTKEE